MKVTTKPDQKAVTSVNLAQSAIKARGSGQIRSPVIDWKEAKLVGTMHTITKDFYLSHATPSSTSP